MTDIAVQGSKSVPTIDLVAEVGSVHDGSVGNAEQLIGLSASCGATIVKFQAHTVEDEMVRNAPSPAYFSGEDRWAYLKRTGFSSDEWQALREVARAHGLRFFSSPFSESAVELLESISVDGYKIASGEVTNHPMLELVASTGKPVHLSSGMSSWHELDAAVEILSKSPSLTIMQATSLYPCPPERVGLNIIPILHERYGQQVGLSDHTLSATATLAAISMGAVVIERHLTFSRAMYGSDARHSLEPNEFSALAEAIAELSIMLRHNVDKDDLSDLEETRHVFQKSIVARRDLAAGTVLSRGDLAFKKPADGVSSSRYRDFVGRTLKRYVKHDEPLHEGDIV